MPAIINDYTDTPTIYQLNNRAYMPIIYELDNRCTNIPMTQIDKIPY